MEAYWFTEVTLKHLLQWDEVQNKLPIQYNTQVSVNAYPISHLFQELLGGNMVGLFGAVEPATREKLFAILSLPHLLNAYYVWFQLFLPTTVAS